MTGFYDNCFVGYSEVIQQERWTIITGYDTKMIIIMCLGFNAKIIIQLFTLFYHYATTNYNDSEY